MLKERRPWLFPLLLAWATLLAYLPALTGQFVWDDDAWTTQIAHLLEGPSGLWTMWCKPGTMQQYYPVTGTSFWLDHNLWQGWTLPYHVENVLAHALGSVLFWRLLLRLRVPGAWLAAAVFAVHPMMVESVAWITERKNVLSQCLYLGALLSYGRFTGFWEDAGPAAADPGPAARSRRAAYWGALILFVVAMLAKATAFSLPAVLLLIGWWKRGRIRWRADVAPSLPFFAGAIALGLVMARVEKGIGAEGADWAYSFAERCLIAGRAIWFYVAKLFWPWDLCFLYPQWQLNTGSVAQWLYPIAAAAVLVALWLMRRRIGRSPATAALFFVGTLFPVLGFMNAYGMRYSFVWDHWVYLSSLGLIAPGAAVLARAVQRLGKEWLLYGVASVLLPTLGVLTWQQSRMYASVETLWRTTIAQHPDCWLAQYMLAYDLAGKGRPDEAIRHYREGLRVKPTDASAHNNLADVLLGKGELEEAIAQYKEAVRLKPDYVDAYCNLGNALYLKGRHEEAVRYFQECLRVNPAAVLPHLGLARSLRVLGRPRDAALEMEAFLRACPEEFLASGQDRVRDAAVVTLNNLAWSLATGERAQDRDGARAVVFAQRACELTRYGKTALVGTLACAYAEAGRMPEAVSAAELACSLAAQAGDQGMMAKNRQLLELYRAGQPYHATAAESRASELGR